MDICIREVKRSPGVCAICSLEIQPGQDYLAPRRKEAAGNKRDYELEYGSRLAHDSCYREFRKPKPRLHLFLYPWELETMDEYSASMPSGTTIGKVWRSNTSITEEPKWVVRMYIPDPDPLQVGIATFDVTLRHGPAPRFYEKPDWSYYKGWLAQSQRLG